MVKVVIGNLKTKKSARTDVLPDFVTTILKTHPEAQAERHTALGIGNRRHRRFRFRPSRRGSRGILMR